MAGGSSRSIRPWSKAVRTVCLLGAARYPTPQLWQISAYVRSLSLPQTLAAQNGPTPSQTPAPVPRVGGTGYGLGGAS